MACDSCPTPITKQCLKPPPRYLVQHSSAVTLLATKLIFQRTCARRPLKLLNLLACRLRFMPANVIARKTLLKRYDSAFRGLAMPPLVLINRHSLRKLLKLAPQLNFASRATSKRKPLGHLLSFRIRRLKKLVPKSPLTLIIEQSRIPR